jgi:hypothetical protein
VLLRWVRTRDRVEGDAVPAGLEEDDFPGLAGRLSVDDHCPCISGETNQEISLLALHGGSCGAGDPLWFLGV